MEFKDCIDKVLKHEGGYVNDPTDRGGETKYGISKKAYPNVDIKNLTLDQAKAIYLKDYWLASKCDDLPAEIRYIHFDTAVNMGIGAASKFVQRLAGVEEDGQIGPVTIKAAKKIKFKDYAVVRITRYFDIVSNNSSQSKYIKGWLNRVVDVIKG